MEIIAKVMGQNTSDGLINLQVMDAQSEQYNIKMPLELQGQIEIGEVFIFEVNKMIAERTSYHLTSFQRILDLSDEAADAILRSFYPAAPMTLAHLKTGIFEAIESITNPTIYKITKNLVTKYADKYFLYPAATKMHHAYIGGLAYHCLSMIKMADAFIINYPYLNKNYLYAGIILHDIGKTFELTGPENTEYTLDGQLIGHLVIGALEVEKMALELGLQAEKEILILKHLLISHHGQPQFGAAKKPSTPEALVLWYVDTIDSKFRVLGEALDKTENGSYTESIWVLDKMRIYKE